MATGDALTVVLAEYNALRGEIDRRSQAQQTLSNLALTLSGATVGYAIANDAIIVLLLQPIIASALGLLYADHGTAIRRLSRYLDKHVGAKAATLAGEPRLMLWEGVVQERRNRAWRPFWLLPPVLVFVVSSAATLVVAWGGRVYDQVARGSRLFTVPMPAIAAIWLIGLFMTALAAIGFYLTYRTNALSAFDEALDAAQRDG